VRSGLNMQKLKKAFASLTGPKPPGNTSPQKSETPESRYEAARDQFLAYNAQLDGNEWCALWDANFVVEFHAPTASDPRNLMLQV
jgi:hypothetical protein